MDFSKELKKIHIQAAILLLTLALYLLTKNPVFLIAIALEIFMLVGIEVRDGIKSHGIRHEFVDTIIALLVAIGIWFGASFILNTSSPLSAVASCSMLPNLDRGDFVLVQGISQDVAAYEIQMTDAQIEKLFSNEALVEFQGKSIQFNGSLFSRCYMGRQGTTFVLRDEEICRVFWRTPDQFIEKHGDLDIRYSFCPIKIDGTELKTPCVASVIYNGTEYTPDFSMDTIVYRSGENEAYSLFATNSGVYSMPRDIVHRVMFKIKNGDKTYYLTRGDNNQILDIQAFSDTYSLGNYPVEQNRTSGKVIMRVPWLGYFKLAVSGLFIEDEQCKTQLTVQHI